MVAEVSQALVSNATFLCFKMLSQNFFIGTQSYSEVSLSKQLGFSSVGVRRLDRLGKSSTIFLKFLMRYHIAICGNKTCYYGICETVNGKKYCRCDERCKILMKPVHGYNKDKKILSTFTNIFSMKKASCGSQQLIKMVHEGHCGE